MKKVIQTNIGGHPFQVDEDAYLLIKDYLDSLKAFFSKEEGSGREIIDDIENRLAELLILRISDKKQVVDLADAKNVIQTLGKIEDFEFRSAASEPEETVTFDRRHFRKLFRDPEDYYIGGVCGGLGAYLNVDPLWIRILFVALIFAHGFGLLLYAIFWIVVPKARTTTEKLQMKGEPVTIENIKRSVSDEYDKVTTTWKNSENLRKTRNVAEEIVSVIGKIIVIFLKIILFFIGLAFLMAGVALLIGLGTLLFARHAFFTNSDWFQWNVPDISGIFTDPMTGGIILICLIFLIGIPVVALIVGSIKLLFNVRTKSHALAITGLTAWILALIILVVMVLTENKNFLPHTVDSKTFNLKPVQASGLIISLDDNLAAEKVRTYSFFNYSFYVSDDKQVIFGKPDLIIREGGNDFPQLTVRKSIRKAQGHTPGYYFDKIGYQWEQHDSLIVLNEFFTMDREEKWSFPEVELVLEIPENMKYELSGNVYELMDEDRHIPYGRYETDRTEW